MNSLYHHLRNDQIIKDFHAGIPVSKIADMTGLKVRNIYKIINKHSSEVMPEIYVDAPMKFTIKNWQRIAGKNYNKIVNEILTKHFNP